jgi:hypothetical protein
MPTRSKVKLSYKDQRDYDLLPARIEALDGEIGKLEEALADGDLYTKNPARFAQLTAALDKARAEKPPKSAGSNWPKWSRGDFTPPVGARHRRRPHHAIR